MKPSKSERVELSMDTLEAILEQARSKPLSEEQYNQLKGVLNTLGRLTQELEKKRTSIFRLRNLLFGPQTEKTADVLKKKKQKANDASQGSGRGQGKKEKRKGGTNSKGYGEKGKGGYATSCSRCDATDHHGSHCPHLTNQKCCINCGKTRHVACASKSKIPVEEGR